MNNENKIKALDTKIARVSDSVHRLRLEIIWDKLSLRTQNLLKHGEMKIDDEVIP
jgi:hypothetical protein